jgi:ABC-type sugar transport system substrate-binding protein
MTMMKMLAGACVALGATMATAAIAFADDAPPPNAAYYSALKGKKIGFVPIAMGFNETQAWRAAMERQAKDLGYEVIVRDPNWSIEAGIQAINSLIAETPDVLVVESIDDRSYNKLVKKAMEAGIPTIQMQLRSQVVSDAYIGPDWEDMGAHTAVGLVKKCGEGSGGNGKVAVIQGALAAPASLFQIKGIEDTLKNHPEIKIVANQAADWDATKAYQIAGTILKQNPDICAIAGFWDVADAGIAAAVKEAGLQGKVAVVTSGSGNRGSACDKLAAGDFSYYTSYNTAGTARDINSAVRMLLQTRPKPGSAPFSLVTGLLSLSKENITPSSCWTLEEIQQFGG